MAKEINAAALLSAWEQAASQSKIARALTLLSMAWPERAASEWGLAPIGERDRRLLTLREELFGVELETTATCPKCGDRLEMNFRTSDVRVPPPAIGDTLFVEIDGQRVEYRLPNSADLLAVSEDRTSDGRNLLLQRCVQSELTLSPDAEGRVIAAMAEADPQADVRIALTCPVCQHDWTASFDIIGYLWGEIDDWARRLLGQIHILATNYGWSESDILALSAWRRQYYIDMIEA